MALRIASQDTLPTLRALTLEGRLDNETAEELNDVLARELPPQIKVLVFDLQHLTYISSMGLRSGCDDGVCQHGRVGRLSGPDAAKGGGRGILITPS